MGNYTLLGAQAHACFKLIEHIRANIDAEDPPLITYGKLADQIADSMGLKNGDVRPQHIGKVISDMMYGIWNNFNDFPPINMLVVNGSKKIVGDGAHKFVDHYYRKKEGWYAQKDYVEQGRIVCGIWNDIQKYQEFDPISALYFSETTSLEIWKKKGNMESEGKEKRLSGGGPAESKEHRRLKYYLLNHPGIAGAPRNRTDQKVEYRLPSHDEADVWFQSDGRVTLIEAKSHISKEPDLIRGVFQCAKYRHIADLMERHNLEGGAGREVNVALAVEQSTIPSRVAKLAETLDIRIIKVEESEVAAWGECNDSWHGDSTVDTDDKEDG